MGSGKRNGLRITIGVLGSLVILGGAGGAIYYLTTNHEDTNEYTIVFDGEKEGTKDIFVPNEEVKFKLGEDINFDWHVNSGLTGTYELDGTSKFYIGGVDDTISAHNTWLDEDHTKGHIYIPGPMVKSKEIIFKWSAKYETVLPKVTGKEGIFNDFGRIPFVPGKKFSIPYSFKEEGYKLDPNNSQIKIAAEGPSSFEEWKKSFPEFSWENGKVSFPADMVKTPELEISFQCIEVDGEVNFTGDDGFDKNQFKFTPFHIHEKTTISFGYADPEKELDADASIITIGNKTYQVSKYWTKEMGTKFEIPGDIVAKTVIDISFVSKVKQHEVTVDGEQFEAVEKEISYVAGEPVTFTIQAKSRPEYPAQKWDVWFDFDENNSTFVQTIGGQEQTPVPLTGMVSGNTVTIPNTYTQSGVENIKVNLVGVKKVFNFGDLTEDANVQLDPATQTFHFGDKLQIKYKLTDDDVYEINEKESKIWINGVERQAGGEEGVGQFESGVYTVSKIEWTDIRSTEIKIKLVSKEKPVVVANALGVTSGNTAVTLKLVPVGMTAQTRPKLQYCMDDKGENWLSITPDNAVTIPANTTYYLRGDNSTGWSQSATAYASLSFTQGNITLSGSIMGLLDNGRGKVDTIPNSYCFAHLFEGSGISVIKGDILSAKTLKDHCYDSMFKGCTSLTTVPNLIAPELTAGCYAHMFEGCTGIVDVSGKEFQAQNKAVANCYEAMFKGCTSLQTIQNSPFASLTTLAEGCYKDMFNGCGKLQVAHNLPASTLSANCYEGMYQGCAAIKAAPQIGEVISIAPNAWTNMFNGCTSLQSAIDMKSVTSIGKEGCEGMYSGCTALTTAPHMSSVKTIGQSGCQAMFINCTGLTAAPTLSAVTALGESACSSMFESCEKLETAFDMVNVALSKSSCNSMYKGCIGLTAAPKLPSIALTADQEGCFVSMFEGCTGLSIAESDSQPAEGAIFQCLGEDAEVVASCVTDMFKDVTCSFSGNPTAGHWYGNYVEPTIPVCNDFFTNEVGWGYRTEQIEFKDGDTCTISFKWGDVKTNKEDESKTLTNSANGWFFSFGSTDLSSPADFNAFDANNIQISINGTPLTFGEYFSAQTAIMVQPIKEIEDLDDDSTITIAFKVASPTIVKGYAFVWMPNTPPNK